jgi:hypothetical protein
MLRRWDVINHLLAGSAEQRFLEIGVHRGGCGARVVAALKVGVDPEALPVADKHYTELHRVASDEFFRDLKLTARFDVVFVDGLHHADQVLRDVDNAFSFLNGGGAVVLHDCNPKSERAQRVPRQGSLDDAWNGDVWKAVVALRRRRDLDVFVIDADCGLGVARRVYDRRPALGGLGEYRPPSLMTYADLRKDRANLLGLVPANDWIRRLTIADETGRTELG